MAKLGFDMNEYDPQDRDFEVMPKGEYRLKATEAEEKTTAAGTGSYIAATFEVVRPSEYNGRRVWQNFNVNNPNDKAEKIGREQLVGWARACGKPNAGDTDELIEREFDCKLDIEKGAGGYSDKNKIASFLMPSVGNAHSKPAPKPASKPAPTPAAEESGAEEEAASESPSKPAPKPAAKPAPAPAGKKKNPWDDD